MQKCPKSIHHLNYKSRLLLPGLIQRPINQKNQNYTPTQMVTGQVPGLISKKTAPQITGLNLIFLALSKDPRVTGRL